MSNINNKYINSKQTSYYRDSINISHNKLFVDSLYIKDQSDIAGQSTNNETPSVYKNKWFFSPLKDSNYLYQFDQNGKLVPINYLRELIGPSLFTIADALSNSNVIVNGQNVKINPNAQTSYQSIPTITDKLFLNDGRVVVFGKFRYPTGYQSGGLGLTQVIAIINKNIDGKITINKNFSQISNTNLTPDVRMLINDETKIFELTSATSSSKATFNSYDITSSSTSKEITYINLDLYDKVSNIQQAIEYNDLVIFVANSYKIGYTGLYAINKTTGITKRLNILFNKSYLAMPEVQLSIINNTLYALPKKNTNDYTLNTKYLFYKISLANIDNNLVGDLEDADIETFQIYNGTTETNIQNITPPNNSFYFEKSTTISTFPILINHFSVDEITGDIYIAAHCQPNITKVYVSNGSNYQNLYNEEIVETKKLGIKILTKFSSSNVKQFEKFYYGTNIPFLTCLDSEYIYTVMPEVTLIGANPDNVLFGLCKTGVNTIIPNNASAANGLFLRNKFCRISKTNGDISQFISNEYDYFQSNHQSALHSLPDATDNSLNSIIVSWPRFGGNHGNKSVAILRIDANNINDDNSSSSSSDSDGYANSSSSSSSQSYSESSYSSQSSESSSSSSSYEILADNVINGIFINQGLHNLLPFSFSIKELNNNYSNDLSFTFGEKSSFNYSFNKDAPNGNENDYNAVKSVDIIVANTYWANDYNLSIFSNNHSYNKVEDFYLTPKFSWDKPIVTSIASANTYSEIVYDFEIFALSTNSEIFKAQFGTYFNYEKIIALDDKAIAMTIGVNSSDIYMTTNNYIEKYKHEEFLTNKKPNTETYEIISKANINQDLLLLEHGDYVWSSQTYRGNLVRRSKVDMEIDYIFTAIDSIKNIAYSEKHLSYFAFGDKNIWKISGNSKTIIYSAGENTIIDASILNNGTLAIILSNNRIKILKVDLFTVIYNDSISAIFNKIINYKNGFVVIKDIIADSISNTYSVSLYIFDGKLIKNNTIVCKNREYKTLSSYIINNDKFSIGSKIYPSDAKIYNDNLIISIESGLFLAIDLVKVDKNYAYKTALYGITNFGIIDSSKKYNIDINKIKIFVGSEDGISDKWESGEIQTSNNYVYYGGGNNLTPGERYYVNIQTYSNEFGWSNISKQEFIMPI